MKTILIVDDDPDVLDSLRRILRVNEYKVFTATNGEECLEKVNEFNPDLVLLDIMMPGMNGLETAESIRKFSDVPIIVVSIKANELNEEITEKYKFAAKIQKPFQSEELLKSINAVLHEV